MGTSLGTKPQKKQPSTSAQPSQQFEKALMALEDICLEIKDGQFTHGKEDIDRLFWQQKLKNITMPLSLALAEYKGPRVFHHHYIHDASGAEIPVMESARSNLVAACERANQMCEDLFGMKGSKLLEERSRLCKALRGVLATA